MAWGFHYDDVDPVVVRRDMDDYPARHGDLPAVGLGHHPRHRGALVAWPRVPSWPRRRPSAAPSWSRWASGTSLVDPRGEPRAFESSPSVDFFVCPRMAHMHNFAGTRELFWQRIETWADWVRAVRTRAALTR